TRRRAYARAHDCGRRPLRRLFRNGAGQERADRRAAHPGAKPIARGLSQGHHRLGRGLASARHRGRARGRSQGGPGRAPPRERRHREGHAARGCGTIAGRRDHRRQDPRARRRCRRRRSRVHLGRARLGRLQTRTHARLCRARGPPSARRQRSDLLMATSTMQDAPVGAQVGRSLPRLQARDKVTGRAQYTPTTRLPGMRHAKLSRSTVAHGRIRSIGTSAAKNVPGVHRVVTSEDVRKVIPAPYYGPAFHDQPILAIDKVHYVGEPVAVVLAADPHVAEEAVQLIVAEYEELPAGFDEVEAAENKILVPEELKTAGTFAALKHLKGRKGTNIALDFKLRRGDVDKAFAAAAQVFEHTFRTQKVLHLALEPFASIADWKESGVTIYTGSQGPSFVRTEIARLLGWPENRVRIKVPYLGGGFGSKLYIKMEALATALSMIVRRPVKIALTMEEQFYTITRHPSTVRIKTGVDKDGRITARKCEVWWNGGAYADVGPRVAQKSGFAASGPYDIENVWIDPYALYTNQPPSGALRGFGVPQLVWAYESHTDMIARALKLDPIKFRRKNVLRDGRPQATGTIVQNANLEAVLDRVAERLNKQPLERGSGPLRRGRGVAFAIKAGISPTPSVANVTIAADGSTILACGTVDMGQGSDTAMAQVVGEVLNIPAETVRVVPRDTDVTPYDMGTLGSRSLFHMGHAVRLAAEEARAKIKALAREVGEQEGSNIPLSELFKKRYGMQAGNIVGTGIYKPDYVPPDPATGLTSNVTPFWMCAAAGAEVEVDTETGHVRVTRLVNVVDCGRPVNPKL